MDKQTLKVQRKYDRYSYVYDWFETINNIKKAGLKPKYKNLALFDVFKRIEAVK